MKAMKAMSKTKRDPKLKTRDYYPVTDRVRAAEAELADANKEARKEEKKATKDMQKLLQDKKVHHRADWVKWEALDSGMDAGYKAKLLKKCFPPVGDADGKVPFLVIDDEYVGSWPEIHGLSAMANLDKLLDY